MKDEKIDAFAKQDDEIGSIVKFLENMRASVAALVKDIIEKLNHINNVVEYLSNTVYDVSGKVKK